MFIIKQAILFCQSLIALIFPIKLTWKVMILVGADAPGSITAAGKIWEEIKSHIFS